MSAPVSKRGRAEPKIVVETMQMSTNSSSSEEDDVSDGDSNMETEIQVDFEGITPSGGDFHGIKRLLQQVFLKARVDLSGLTEIIIAQGGEVGSVIKQSEVPEEEEFGDDKDDDDHVFGITSVVNLTDRLKESKCIQQLHSLLLERGRTTGDDRTLKLLQKVLNANDSSTIEYHVGLLINERFVNIPPLIAAPLYENLLKEMHAANQKSQRFLFDYYILISKLYKSQTPSKSKIKKADSRISTVDVFSNPEDEMVFERDTIAWFEYSVASESDSGLDGDWDADNEEGMIPFRRISIIPASELSAIVAQIKDTFVGTVNST